MAALKLRDPEAAQQAMHKHLNHVEQKLKQLVLAEEPAASSLEVG